jgi:hypothetical protein
LFLSPVALAIAAPALAAPDLHSDHSAQQTQTPETGAKKEKGPMMPMTAEDCAKMHAKMHSAAMMGHQGHSDKAPKSAPPSDHSGH